MPFETIVYLTLVISALTLFAVTVAYAEGAARHARDPVRKPHQFRQVKPMHRNDSDLLRKAG